MPYTIIYTEASKCKWCGKPMREWTAFAEVHYHPECWLEMCSQDFARVLAAVVAQYEEQRQKLKEMN